MKALRLLAAALGLAALVRADITLAPLFQDHVVLQRDQPVPVWGWAEAGEHVTVSFRGRQFSTTAFPDGRWIVYFDALTATSEPSELIVTGKNTVTIADVVVGEVWLASGQSNMEWPVAKSGNAAQEIASAHFPLVRHIKIERTVAAAPAETVKSSGWQAATPTTAGQFSAAAYFFARELHRKLGVPVGVINSTWGGTGIELWLSPSAMRSTSAYAAIDARWQGNLAEFPERQAHFPAEWEAWTKAEKQAKATQAENPLPRPRPIVGPRTGDEPGSLFNGMISPLVPFAIRGVIWYQGETNVPRPDEYAELFPAMIRSWRAAWGQGNFPFYFVQLAGYGPADERSWARLREAQTHGLEAPATGMATAVDIGDASSSHPRNKQEVGRRLALIAEAQAYGLGGEFSGPTFQHVTYEGSAIRVYFRNTGTGLSSGSQPVQSVEIAGEDRRFFPGVVRIEGGTLLVSAPEVKTPVAVRYAWSNFPSANLYNSAGLPAFPFRSDAW